MSARRPALAMLNPRARQGQAGRMWPAVAAELEQRFALVVAEVDEGERAVDAAWRSGTRCFIAAGGDGTVHALANALLGSGAELSDCIVGAVGLGSSNDFHKPTGRRIAAVAARIDADAAEPRDLGLATFEDDRGMLERRAFLISGSLGACARANAIFNRGGLLQRAARRLSPDAAVLLAGLRAIATHRDIAARLRLDGGTETATRISNLSVMKTPWLGGALSYDLPVAPADGLFAVNLCEGMGRRELAATLAALSLGRFVGRPKTRHALAREVRVVTAAQVALELDGELYGARRVDFALIPSALRVCR